MSKLPTHWSEFAFIFQDSIQLSNTFILINNDEEKDIIRGNVCLGLIVLVQIQAHLRCSYIPKQTELRRQARQVSKQTSRCEITLRTVKTNQQHQLLSMHF